MTSRDTRRNFLRLLDETWPGVQSEFVAAMRQARAGVDMRALEAAIARGDVAAAFRALRFDAADMFRTDTAITAALAAGGNYQMGAFQHATRRAPIGSRVVQSFGGRNERAERIARDLGARLVTEVVDDTRVLIAQTIRAGLEAGAGPLRTALDIGGRVVNGTRQGGLVGLHSTQAGYVQNMRGELTDPDRMANYFTRTRRDKRFDGIVRRAIADGKPVAQADIDRMAARYSDRLLALRGETIARTETLKALNAGRQEALDQLIENPNNDVRAEDVVRAWDSAGDGKTRPTHVAADLQDPVPQGQPFIVGGYSLMYPGDTSLGAPAEEVINCRCYVDVRIDFFAGLARAEGVVPDKPLTQPEINARTDIEMKNDVVARGQSTGTEHLRAYDAATGREFSAVSGSQDLVLIPDDMIEAIGRAENSVVAHHNHPSSRPFSRQDLEMVGRYPGLKTLYAHGHDGSEFKVERVISFGAADLDRANNDVARPFIRFESRFASKEDQILLFQHAFPLRLSQKGFVKYSLPESGAVRNAYNRNQEIFDAIMGAM